MRPRARWRCGLGLCGLAAGVLLLQGAPAAAPAAAPATSLADGMTAIQLRRFATALRILAPLAAGGDPEAELELGGLYDLGEGVPVDPVAALRWYRAAAERGLAAAELDVALMYDTGRGTPPDPEAAALWYARAAVRGEPRAAYDMGQLYQDGEGVPRNDDIAAAWFHQAQAGGVSAASLHLAALAKPPPRPAAGSAPAAATLLAPADNAVVPADVQTPSVELVWTLPEQPSPSRFYVEAVPLNRPLGAPLGTPLGQSPAEPVLRAYVATSATLLKLPEAGGRYLWRVFTVSVDQRTYTASPWHHFATAPLPTLQAAR